MRLRQLRQVLQQIVIAGLPLAAASCGSALGGDCYETLQKTYRVASPADPPLELRVESCRRDVDACPELCATVMSRDGINETALQCKVRFLDDIAEASVAYEVFTGGPGCPVDGRRPAGLVTPRHLPAANPIGAWLAQAAWLEAASVHAFAHLARELALLGAPRALVAGALVAARDEVQHTTLMSRLAARYGAVPPAVEVTLPAPRGLDELAIENAAEGCVRETWGAVLALWQSHTARDPEVRAAFAQIGRDETRHAALAWAVDRWAAPRLSHAARAAVEAARVAAARELLDGPELDQMIAIGLPHGAAARTLLSRTHAALWAGGVS